MKYLAAILFAFFSNLAVAAGQWDGIYQVGDKAFLSVHQNGSSIIIGAFSTIPSWNIMVLLTNEQGFVPPRIDQWDLFSGTLFGSTVTVTGETAYGACNSSATITFTTAGATITRNFLSNTAAGTAQGVNCASLFQTIVNIG
ncbi:MAG: hypothetical protein JWQ33_1761, partial [Ramlibacter sp.]|nr:hypothetical protein [Ramlibacter sp.]